MNILAIETSCDETAAAVVKDGLTVLSSAVSSQIEVHRPYKGVVPEVASRAHALTLNQVVEEALEKARISSGKASSTLDAVAVTVGPGLVGALLVGRMAAETLGWIWKVPVYGVNHIEGHLLSPLLFEKSLKPPFLGLVVSGGHTELILAKNWGDYFLLGRTRDDAAGEAFDKVAKMLDLGYPGGPVIDKLAKRGNPERSPFPRAWLENTWDFSFSGLKTAVLYRLREKKSWTAQEKKDICAGFQRSVVDVLVTKSVAAARALGIKTLVVGGGVAANSLLRSELTKKAAQHSIRVVLAPPTLCTDNAAMIATAAFFKLKNKQKGSTSQDLKIQAQIHLPLYTQPLAPFRRSST